MNNIFVGNNTEPNVEQARKTLEAKLSSIGYEHPKEDVHNLSPYKVFNETENMVDTYSSGVYETYATFSHDAPIENQIQKTDICPVCEKKALYACDCEEYQDLMCVNNHTWYVDKTGKLRVGDPHGSD